MSEQLAIELGMDPKPQAGTTTFASNMKLPVHRWFRYSAGFSAEWVESVLPAGYRARVLDPFAGSGTTLLAAQGGGHESIGLDPHPLISRVASAKLQWQQEPEQLLELAQQAASAASPAALPEPLPPLLEKCFPTEALSELLGLRDSVMAISAPSELKELLWLAFTSIVRHVSPVGTAQWQYVLPSKTKAKHLAVADAWAAQVALMAGDMRARQELIPHPGAARIVARDARDIGDAVPAGWATHIICSPPYANNYDYGDATRLEQTVLGEVSGWADLKEVRTELVRACTQQMSGFDAESALSDPLLAPIEEQLRPIYHDLSEVRLVKGGRKAYHDMVVAYFHDMSAVWRSLRSVTDSGATVCFVVGDSAPYGVHVPVERLLADLAESQGFTFVGFTKVRDRNVKWKNRKHRVPLHEGYLWMEG